jgi:hypothetical protein
MKMVFEIRNAAYPNPVASAIRVPGVPPKYTLQLVRADARTERVKYLYTTALNIQFNKHGELNI